MDGAHVLSEFIHALDSKQQHEQLLYRLPFLYRYVLQSVLKLLPFLLWEFVPR